MQLLENRRAQPANDGGSVMPGAQAALAAATIPQHVVLGAAPAHGIRRLVRLTRTRQHPPNEARPIRISWRDA